MQHVRGLIFDKDGTLFEFQRTWARWCTEFITEVTGGDPARMQAIADGLGFDLATARFRRTSPMVAGTIQVQIDAVCVALPELSADTVREMVLRTTAATPQVAAVPLAPLLDRLAAAGYTLGLATNDAERPARAHLTAAGILENFRFIAGYDTGFGAKPGPGMLEAFCRQTGIPPAACAIIGDSTHDLASGRAAGMTTIGVLTGMAEAEDLAHLADAILPDVGELPGLLGLRAA